MRAALRVLGFLAALFVAACLDEWRTWRQQRCQRAAMRRNP